GARTSRGEARARTARGAGTARRRTVAPPARSAAPVMNQPAYPAARIVAPKIEAHFAQHIAEAERRAIATAAAPPDAREVAAPGLIVVKHHRGGDAGKFVNVAVLEGDRIKIVDERASSLPDCPPLLTSLLGFDSPASWIADSDTVNVLVQLAVSMRAHGRGGLLLVVPAGADAWQDSIVRPIPYAVEPPFQELSALTREPRETKRTRHWQETVNRAVEAIAGLTAVDGATIMTTGYELLAFGAKIARRKGSPQVEQVTITEPV